MPKLNHKFQIFGFGIFLVFNFWLLDFRAIAATTPQGITISPAFHQVDINVSVAEQPVSFTITNHKAAAETFKLKAADFSSLSDSGGLFFVGTNPTQLQKEYGLAKWLIIPQNQITLEPGQTATIQADIQNLPSLSPGGHYGALLISEVEPGGSNGSQVSIQPVVSSLMFVTKLGGDTHRLSLNKVSVQRVRFGLPSSVSLRFYNNGNTHLIPRGVVSVLSASGNLIEQGIVNNDSDIILPQIFRQYDVPLRSVSSAPAAGNLKLRVDFRFDGTSQYRSYEQGLFYFPTSLAALILVFFGLALFASGRRYTKRRYAKCKRRKIIVRAED